VLKSARLSSFVRRTHEKVRTLTCLARKLSLASRLEHSNQTNNSRRWPSVPCFPCRRDQNYWKMELAPYRCSAPHSPSLDPGWNKCGREEGVAGTIARILRRSVLAHACFQCIDPAEKLLFPVYRNRPKPARHTSRPRATCATTGSRFTRNLLTISSWQRRVKLHSVNLRSKTPGSPCSTQLFRIEHGPSVPC
jgi:hypothetical protein